MKRLILAGVLLALTGSDMARAEVAVDTSARTFGYRPLELFEFKTGTGLLFVKDVNKDGRDDVVFSNNRASRIEVLLSKAFDGSEEGELPELEQRFDKAGLLVDDRIVGMELEDINGDGYLDLVSFGSELGLQIRFFEPSDTSWSDPSNIYLRDLTDLNNLFVEDMNRDGRFDLIIFRNKEVEILWNEKDLLFGRRKRVLISGGGADDGAIGDVNQDGHQDLLLNLPKAAQSLGVRLGCAEEGVYGPLQGIELPPSAFMDLLKSNQGPVHLLSVLPNRSGARYYSFTKDEQPELLELKKASPWRINWTGSNAKHTPAFLTADLDADGYDDLLAAAPELSRLHLYRGGKEGLRAEPEAIDTLSGVSALSLTGKGDVLVYSAKEKTAAIHSGKNLQAFPAKVPADGDVLMAEAQPGGLGVWMLLEKDDQYELMLTGPDDSIVLRQSMDIEDAPSKMLVFKLAEHLTALVAFVPYEDPVVLQFDGKELSKNEKLTAMFLGVKASDIFLKDRSDGSELTLLRDSIARVFSWKDGEYRVIRQLNPEQARAHLTAACQYQFGKGKKGHMVYDRSSREISWFEQNAETSGKIYLPGAESSVSAMLQLQNPHKNVLLVIDRVGIDMLIGKVDNIAVTADGEYVSPAKDPAIAYGKAVQVGFEKERYVALVDVANRSIELLKPDGKSQEPELVFEVYQASSLAQAKRGARIMEPRQVESGDLNADGLADLVVLCHDKLLLYLGE